MAQTKSFSAKHGVCTWWKAYTFDNPIRKLIHPRRKLLGPYVKESMTAMDVGCGMGYFSIGMAELVGSTGKVVAVDLQQKMLDVMLKRAARAGMADRIIAYRCQPHDVAVNEKADFILAFWMVHEVPDQNKFFRQVKSMLADEGRVLIGEPKMHVTAYDFKRTLETAKTSGLQCCGVPYFRFSRTALLKA